MSWIQYSTQKLGLLTSSNTLFVIVCLFCIIWVMWEMLKWGERLSLDSDLHRHIYFAIAFAPVFWTFILLLIYISFQYLFNRLLQQGSSHLLNNLIASFFTTSLLLNYFLSRKSTKVIAALESVVRWLSKLTEFQRTYETLERRDERFCKFLDEKCWLLGILDRKITIEDEKEDNSVANTRSKQNQFLSILAKIVAVVLILPFVVISVVIAIMNTALIIMPLRILYSVPMLMIPRMFLFSVLVPVHVLSQRILKESLHKSVMKIATLLALFAILLNWLFNYLALSSK